MAVMASLEALWTKQRVNQVPEDQHCGDAGNDVVHKKLSALSFQLETVACLDEIPAHDQKRGPDTEIEKVEKHAFQCRWDLIRKS
jgi:hypothetical protein